MIPNRGLCVLTQGQVFVQIEEEEALTDTSITLTLTLNLVPSPNPTSPEVLRSFEAPTILGGYHSMVILAVGATPSKPYTLKAPIRPQVPRVLI